MKEPRRPIHNEMEHIGRARQALREVDKEYVLQEAIAVKASLRLKEIQQRRAALLATIETV